MSKAFGGVEKLLKPKHKREREKIRATQMAEAEADRQFRARLQSIKDKLDLFGEEALSKEEMAIVAERRAFFYPEPWHPGQLA